jgi:hypothetical protein
MNRGLVRYLAFVMNFLFVDWKPHHVTIGSFKANDTIGDGLVSQLKVIFENFGFISKILCYVKMKVPIWGV